MKRKMKTELLSLNRPQTNFVLNLGRSKYATSIWGRGAGKSAIIYWIMQMINERMPRSTWVIQGASFQQILTRTLPGTLAFAEKHGCRRDIDYFINRRPPKNYLLPYEAPLKDDNVIYFVNHRTKCSVAFTLFSQDRSSSRGPNRDGIICDESLLLDWDKFTTEAMATNRGNEKYFSQVPFHHGVFHFSSMPFGQNKLTDQGKYIEDTYDFNGLRNQVCDLQLGFMKSNSRKEKLELWADITELQKRIKFFPSKQGLYYSEYNAFDNIENLGLRYITDQYNSMSELLFAVEILNKRVTKIEDSFYPLLDRNRHTYKGDFNYSHLDNMDFDFDKLVNADSRQDADCNPNLPLDVGIDFGVAINWMTVGQHIKPINQFNFIKNLYVKTPLNIDDLAMKFCEYYQHHKKKVVYLWPDGEGNIKQKNTPNHMSYVDQLKIILQRVGWQVIVMKTESTNVRHKEKYFTWSRCLSESDPKFPKIRFNLINCKELIYSMEQTGAIDYGNTDIRKNKSSEKKLIANREQATDAGDAADQIVFYKFGTINKGGGSTVLPFSS